MKSLRNFSASSDTLPEKLLSLKDGLSKLTLGGFSGLINGILMGVLEWGCAICGISVVGVLTCGLAGYGVQGCWTLFLLVI